MSQINTNPSLTSPGILKSLFLGPLGEGQLPGGGFYVISCISDVRYLLCGTVSAKMTLLNIKVIEMIHI